MQRTAIYVSPTKKIFIRQHSNDEMNKNWKLSNVIQSVYFLIRFSDQDFGHNMMKICVAKA